jgi:hypothetical protein
MIKLIIFGVLIFSSLGLWFIFSQLENKVSAPLSLGMMGTSTVIVTHSYDSGIHRYTGNIKLPHSCYDLRLNENGGDPYNRSTYVITLHSSDRMLEQRLCAKIVTRYPFQLVVDGPVDMKATLELNGVEMPMELKETPWVELRGNITTNPKNIIQK